MMNYEAFKAIQTLIDIRNEGYKDEDLKLKTYIDIEEDRMFIEGHNAAILIGSMYTFLSPMVLYIHMVSDREVNLY